MDGIELVKGFLRAQNLEQLARTDEAIEIYEKVIAGGFDATGPYDRLIAIYSNRAHHRDVSRVAQRALENVQTHDAKKAWYGDIKMAAERAEQATPPAAPKSKRG